MRTESENTPSIPLDNIYATQDGFIARHFMFKNDPLNELASLRWWTTGNVRLTIPINFIRQHHLIQDDMFLRFVQMMGERRNEYRFILNMDQWLVMALTLAGRYLNLRDKLKAESPIYGKIIFSNARSTTPFVGMESFLTTIEKYGLPVCQDSVTAYPPGMDSTPFVLLNDPGGKETTFSRSVGLMVPLTFSGLRSLGVMFDGATENLESFGLEFGRAVMRGAGIA